MGSRRGRCPRLEDAQFVAVGIGEDDVLGVRSLADIQVPGAQLKRSLDRGRLFVDGGRFQVGVHLVGTPLLAGTGNETQTESHLGQCRQ